MPSPFPGMDPYMEPGWRDVHAKLIAFSSDVLNASLPDDLVARSEERIGVVDPESIRELQNYYADVRVTGDGRAGGEGDEGGVAVDAPIKIVVDEDMWRERSLRIVSADRPGDDDAPDGADVITAIEFLSPSNKRGRGLAHYLERRERLLLRGVHVVEIDLVRAGNWRAILEPHEAMLRRVTTYRASVRRAGEPEAVYLYPIGLADALPPVAIPLRPGDPEVKLALQPLIDRAYDGGRYARTIDYRKPPDPPLDEADAAWVDELLRAAGKR